MDRKKFTLFLVALVAWLPAAADDLTIFVPNTPARAEDVNGNFRELEDRINNHADALELLSNSVGASSNRSVDCVGTNDAADYKSLAAAIENRPTGHLTLHVSGICQENVTLHGLGGIDIVGDPFDGTVDGISAAPGGQPALNVVGSLAVQLLDLEFSADSRTISITGSSDVYIGFSTVTATSGGAIDIEGSQLTIGFDVTLAAGTDEGSAALSARNATVAIAGTGAVFNAQPGVFGAKAVSLALNSSFESTRQYTPTFNGAVDVGDGAALRADGANIGGTVRVFNRATLSLVGAEANPTVFQLNNYTIDIEGGASARFDGIDVATRILSVEGNSILQMRNSIVRTNTLSLSFGGGANVEVSTVNGDVLVGSGALLRQGVEAVINGTIDCASDAFCL